MMPENWSALALGKWVAALLMAQWLTIPGSGRHGLTVLMVLMGVDLLTGVWAGMVKGDLSSMAGFQGVSRKLAILAFLLFMHWLQHVVDLELNLALAGSIGYSINELISIVENFSRIGVPIPSQLLGALLQAKKMRFTPATEEQLRQLREDADKDKSKGTSNG